MKLIQIILSLITACGILQAAVLTGIVRDQATGQGLAYANILLLPQNQGIVSDRQGNFVFKNLLSGEITLQVRYMGYQIFEKTFSIEDLNASLEVIAVLTPRDIEGDRVVVTATRYAKSLDEVSQPVTVIDRKQLVETAPLTPADALAGEAGIDLGRDGAWGTRVAVRGLSREKLVTLVDGYRIDTAEDLAAGLSMIDLNDVERIEVIRGGSSALYGSGAIGGVINIITRDAFFSPAFYVRGNWGAQYGSVNNLWGSHLNFSAGHQRWYARLSLAARNADNIHTPEGVLTNSQFNDNNISFRSGFIPGAHQQLKFNYQKFHAWDVGIPGGYPLFPSEADVRYPAEDRQLYSLEYEIHSLFSFWPKVAMKVYRQTIERNVENIPHTVKNIPATADKPASRVSVLSVRPGAEHLLNGLQMQSEFLPHSRHYFVVGYDFWQKDYKGYRAKEQQIDLLDSQGAVVKTTSKIIGELPMPDSYYRNHGFFAQDEWQLIPASISVLVGGRWDAILTENEPALNPLYEIVNGVRNDQPAGQYTLWAAEKSFNHSWSANLSLRYQWQKLALSMTAARSFRSPYLEERYQFIDLGSLVKVGNPDLEPEYSRFYDWGMSWFGPKLEVNGHFFLNDLQDLVVEMPGVYEGRNALFKTNIGEARLWGFDGSLRWQALKPLEIGVNLAYVKGEDRMNNTPLPAIAPLNSRMSLRWQIFPLLEWHTQLTWFAKQDRIAEGEIETAGYSLLDTWWVSDTILFLGIGHSWTLGVENIFDESYRNHLSTNRSMITAEAGRNFSIRWQMNY